MLDDYIVPGKRSFECLLPGTVFLLSILPFITTIVNRLPHNVNQKDTHKIWLVDGYYELGRVGRGIKGLLHGFEYFSNYFFHVRGFSSEFACLVFILVYRGTVSCGNWTLDEHSCWFPSWSVSLSTCIISMIADLIVFLVIWFKCFATYRESIRLRIKTPLTTELIHDGVYRSSVTDINY